MENKILEKFKNGEQSIGTFTHLKSMEAVEAIGVSGMEFVVIDMEHCPIDLSEAAKYVTSADNAGVVPFVRVPEISRAAILKPLDIGAKGIIVPCIETADQVREVISYGKFKPVGFRGYCMSRDGQWGYDKVYKDGLRAYMDDANEKSLLIVQCETVKCVENIEEIVSLDGLDGIMIGPNDLSIGMDMPGQFKNETFLAAIDKVLKACKEAGKMTFIFCHNAEEAREKLAQGFDCAIVGIDILTLISSYKKLLSDINL